MENNVIDNINLPDNIIFKKYKKKESILFNLSSRKEYKLNEEGADILYRSLLGNSIDNICSFIKDKYEVTQGEIVDKIENFYENLLNKGLVLKDKNKGTDGNAIKDDNCNPPLDSLMIELTENCNLSCKHCYMNSQKLNFEELSEEEVFNLVDEAIELGVFKFTLTGGEPLLTPYIMKLMENINDKKCAVNLFTNGTLIDERKADKISSMKYVHVITSLDGATSKTHDNFRGEKESFEKTLNCINLLKERDVPVRINVTLTNFNAQEIENNIDFFLDLSNRVVLGDTDNLGRAEDRDINISTEKFLEIQKKLLKKNFSMTDKNKLDNIKEELKEGGFEELGYCGVGKYMCFVSASGKVSLCPTLSHRESSEFVVGSINESSLKDIWENGDSFERFRDINCNKEEGCKYSSICLGGCRSRAYLRYGGINELDKLACGISKILYSLLDDNKKTI